ncbi:MAG TPA: putative metal-binding motif-containing protein, partial [Candidatus Binatia bacterium]|nr:putative metal-binding motif-containing protein [Candidatus Binatia bacterium]
ENDEICDGLDNDCDGHLNENVMNYGAACASDDGLPAPGHGLCRTTGTFVCNGNHALACSAVKADCSTLAGGCTEVCDGLDNDCDGSVDETFNAKGANATHFVKPVVTKIASALWIYSYEASRPSATAVISGTGNGYWTSAPSGETLDKTVACSASGKIPWFNVSPQEVEQVCTAMGGAICTVSQWQSACTTNPPSGVTCRWGYNPRGSSCTATRNGSKFCNIAPYDFSGAADGDQDGLLPTASASLQNCWADWSGLLGNTGSSAKISDVTGNVREITKEATNVYRLMGGGFSGDSEDGSECGFTFYGVDQFFKYFDTGFRCCFTSDPTL